MGTGKRRISTAVRGLVGRVERVIARAQVIDQAAVLEPAAESLAIDQAAARARVIVRGAELGLAIDQAAVPELAIVLAEALVLAIVPAEVQEPETALVEAAPERGPVAAPPRIKWVTAVHLRGPVRLLAAVEDLAAVAEIMHAQAATEAATAWAAAVKAAVVAPE